MKIERFEDPGLAQYSYVVSDGGESVVIDAIRDVERYLTYAEREGLRIKAVVETHIHADFAAGSCELADVSGAELALSAYDTGECYVYAMPHRVLRDRDEIQIGQVVLSALHTPGHTPEHLSFVLHVAAEPVAIFSGDFLFVGSLGRPDLLGEDSKLRLARAMYGTVQSMKGLPDALMVYPGHGAGSFCGAGMKAAGETTLGAERRSNPFFAFGEEAFIAELLGTVPEMPSYYPRMKALNAAGAKALDLLPGRIGVAAEKVEVLMREQVATLLDVRGVSAFSAAHVPGSIHIPAGPSLSLWAGWLLDAASPLVLVTDGDDDVDARLALARVGLDNVMGHVEGGVAGWVARGFSAAQMTQVKAEEIGDSMVLDVRNRAEREHGSIPGSVHIPLGDLLKSTATMRKEREIVTICGSGLRASIAASLLEREGFAHVMTVARGMASWDEAQKLLVKS